MEVTFFTARAAEFAPPAEIDPDRDPAPFARGEVAWTVQTFARLARAGLPATLTDRVPRSGLVVFHVKERQALLRALPRDADLLLVGIRADNSTTGAADVEVVQNGFFADDRRRFFVPHWPQPGLRPRDPKRGETIRRAAFKGFARNLAPAFSEPEWREFLAGHGIEWVTDAVDFGRGQADLGGHSWGDFSDIDLIVAVRTHSASLHRSKPATKLYNAWHAGVPAVLGAEHAFRELRRSELDYLEARDLDEAKAAVNRLVEQPERYRAMVENGLRRAPEFGVATITECWRALLFDRLPAFAESERGRLLRRLPVRVKAPVRRVLRMLALRPSR